MRYEEVIKGLISSVKPDDPYASFKKLQIERWGRLWWMLADYQSKLDLFVQVLSDEACWDKTEDFYKIKLNVNQLGKKLINPDTTYYSTRHKSIKHNHLMFDDLYRIACWCCLEDDIHRLFNQKLKNHSFHSKEDVVDFIDCRNRGPLMIFWSHYINKDKYPVRNRERWTDEYGFECAMAEKHVEALEFFWDKIESNKAFSLEKKEQLLFNVALYRSINGSANVEMIEFCLRHLKPNRYADLLKADFNNNKCYLILSDLISGHSIEYSKLLFSILKPEDVSLDKYASSIMYGSLRDTISLLSSDNYFVNTHNELTVFMLNRPGFEAHKQYFLNKLCRESSPSREDMASLIRIGRAEAVWEILNSASTTQIQSIMKSREFDSLDGLVECWGDKDSASKIIKYRAVGSDVLDSSKPLNVSENIEHLTQSVSAVATEKTSAIVLEEDLSSLSNSQSINIRAVGDFRTNHKSQDFL